MISWVESFTPVLSTEILESCNFFELYPFDGGGAFVNRDLLGSVDDKLITRAIMHGGAFDDFGSLKRQSNGFINSLKTAGIEVSVFNPFCGLANTTPFTLRSAYA